MLIHKRDDLSSSSYMILRLERICLITAKKSHFQQHLLRRSSVISMLLWLPVDVWPTPECWGPEYQVKKGIWKEFMISDMILSVTKVAVQQLSLPAMIQGNESERKLILFNVGGHCLKLHWQWHTRWYDRWHHWSLPFRLLAFISWHIFWPMA